jgi:hypothetical protein
MLGQPAPFRGDLARFRFGKKYMEHGRDSDADIPADRLSPLHLERRCELFSRNTVTSSVASRLVFNP